jgi:hypothetical protein
LKYVYDPRLQVAATLLTGNQALVEVLRYALGPKTQAKAFVNPMKPLIKQYAKGGHPKEQVLVFDEAQRAWDRDKLKAKHPELGAGDVSEPQVLMRIARRIPDWSIVVALIGEGQEIFTGEEAGISQWNEAVDDSWAIHGPEHLRHRFPRKKYTSDDSLNLTLSLRSHVASNAHVWGGCALEGKMDPGGAQELRNSGFRIYITRDFDLAAKYLRDRYGAFREKRYGILISSRARSLFKELKLDRVPSFRLGQWYEADPASAWSCCALSTAASEFESQGLELDFPIVCWGEDFRRKDGNWIVPKLRYKDTVRDPYMLRKNAYRVLLSRSRDGMILYVPPKASLDETATFLGNCGAETLT